MTRKSSIEVVRRTFGPKLNADQRRVAGYANRGGHASCWVNDDDCGAEDCPMASEAGAPVIVRVAWTEVRHG
jgi:hypothetical protein